jgi:RimJ/RimL family protein N-acetyltransferase
MITLETERLILRMWREEDFEAYAPIFADPDVMRYVFPGRPLTRLEAWGYFVYLVGHWHLRGYGHWALEEKSSGRLIGRVGLAYPDGASHVELGWIIGREYWGRGYAGEGARRALEFAFSELQENHIISTIHPENRASIRVAEKLGETLTGKAENSWAEHLVYAIEREQWLAHE